MIIEIILFVLIFVAFFVGHIVGWNAGHKQACYRYELALKIERALAKPHHEGGHL